MMLKRILAISAALLILTACSSSEVLIQVLVGQHAPEIGSHEAADRPKVSEWEEIPITLHMGSQVLPDLEAIAFPLITGGNVSLTSFDHLYTLAFPGKAYTGNWYPSIQYSFETEKYGTVLAVYDLQYITTNQFESIQHGYIQYYGTTPAGRMFGVHMVDGYSHVYLDKDIALIDFILSTDDIDKVAEFISDVDGYFDAIPELVPATNDIGYYVPTIDAEDVAIDLASWKADYILWQFGSEDASTISVTNMQTGEVLQIVCREDIPDLENNYGDWRVIVQDGYAYAQHRTPSNHVVSIMGSKLLTEKDAQEFIDKYVMSIEETPQKDPE